MVTLPTSHIMRHAQTSVVYGLITQKQKNVQKSKWYECSQTQVSDSTYFHLGPISTKIGQRSRSLDTKTVNKLLDIWGTYLLTGGISSVSCSGANCKLGLTHYLLSAQETPGMDGCISRWHSAPISVLVYV